MNSDRIASSIDTQRMNNAHVTIVGGAYGLAHDLVRCGLGSLSYIDFDRIDASNPARQDFNSTDVGQFKARMLVESLRRINGETQVEYFLRDFCDFGTEEFDTLFGHTDLFIFATDSFPAQARGNLEAIRLRKPAIFIGLYREGRAGEVIFWNPGSTPACYRCICSSRYQAFAAQSRNQADPTSIPSTGGTILDLHLVDAIAGQIAVGLLTAGAENRFGRLIGQLKDRNLLQIKIDPTYTMGGRDIFADHLGSNPANFSFNTIALPMEAEDDCPDCRHLRQARKAEPCAGL